MNIAMIYRSGLYARFQKSNVSTSLWEAAVLNIKIWFWPFRVSSK